MAEKTSLSALAVVTERDAGSVTLSEASLVICWRLAQLSEAGYPDEAAAILASCPDVDLHQALELLVHGCPPETAIRILA